MTYYFTLSKENANNFYSSNWIVFGEERVFGGGVILKTPNNINKLFRCSLLGSSDTRILFEIDLSEDDAYTSVVSKPGYITLVKLTNDKNIKPLSCASLHYTTEFFDKNVEEPYHYYHFAVTLRETLILTGGKHEPAKSIRIVDIVKSNGATIEFALFDEKMMFRPDGTIYYVYSVKIPDKYLESFYLERNSFTKLLYLSDIVTGYNRAVVVVMYRSINGPKGLKDSMGLEERGTSLKNFLQPETNWLYKPFSLKPVEPECNIVIDTPKDFIPPYSVADSRISILEVLKEMSMFESDKRVRIPEIKEVIFNGPATVVYWTDGDKTRVKCGKNESYDREKAVAMCLIKKMLKPSKKCHWLDVIHDAIQAADDKVTKAEADKAEKARIKAENIAKAEEARRKKAEKKAKELQSEIQKLETKSLEEMNSEVEGKDEHKDVPVKVSKNEVSEEYVEKVFDQAVKENKKWAEQVDNKGKKNKIDQDLMLECIKEKLTIDEIAEMNSWDKAAVARMYYKITGTKPEKKPNTYSELDALFEQGVSVDAAARRTGFSKKIVAMRYAKLQNKKDKE